MFTLTVQMFQGVADLTHTHTGMKECGVCDQEGTSTEELRDPDVASCE